MELRPSAVRIVGLPAALERAVGGPYTSLHPVHPTWHTGDTSVRTHHCASNFISVAGLMAAVLLAHSDATRHRRCRRSQSARRRTQPASCPDRGGIRPASDWSSSRRLEAIFAPTAISRHRCNRTSAPWQIYDLVRGRVVDVYADFGTTGRSQRPPGHLVQQRPSAWRSRLSEVTGENSMSPSKPTRGPRFSAAGNKSSAKRKPSAGMRTAQHAGGSPLRRAIHLKLSIRA